MNDSFDTKMWLCSSCGYAMDQAMPVNGNARSIKTGDISLCMNCAEVFTYGAGKWRVALEADMDKLPLATVGEIVRTKLAICISRSIHGDLSKKDMGRA